MTSSATTCDNSHRRLERSIEIYENERLWIGRGFSRNGLLPTERGPYSTGDGSASWRTIKDAGVTLLGGCEEADVTFAAVGGRRSSFPGNNDDDGDGKADASGRGWSFREGEDDRRRRDRHRDRHRHRGGAADDDDDDDVYDAVEEEDDATEDDGDRGGFVACFGTAADGATDVDGWQYFHDFSPQSLTNPNAKRGILDFVRRRKLRRVAIFRPDHFLEREVYSKCDFCDSGVVDMLSSAMLDALALATLFAHGTKNPVSDAQALTLKFKLIDSLSIGNNHRDGNDPARCEVDRDPPRARIDEVRDRLCTFAETCVGRPGQLAHLFNPDVDRNLAAAMPDARVAMSRYFDERERMCLARLLIKDVDRRAYEMHCRNEFCSMPFLDDDPPPPCEFRLISCPNDGCIATFSFRRRDEHDAECGHKLCPCPNNCGADVPRREVNVHVREKCSLRQAECPLSMFGCNTIVQAQDVACHLNDHADKHFALVANRMMEYESVIKDMCTRIRQLEEKNARLERELKDTTASLQSKEHAKSLSVELNKLAKRLGTLEGTCQSEFKKLQHDRRSHVK